MGQSQAQKLQKWLFNWVDLTYLPMIIDSKSMHLIGNPHEIKQDILKFYSHIFGGGGGITYLLRKMKLLIYLAINFQLAVI